MESQKNLKRKISVQKHFSRFVEQLNSTAFNRWVFTDIHGHYHHFAALLDTINYQGDGRLIFLGDYIDRGPYAEQVISRIRELQDKFGKDKVIALQGNHEDMLCQYMEAKINQTFPQPLLFEDQVNFEIEKHYEWIKSLPFIHSDQDYHYVHGGLNPQKSIEKQQKDEVLWLRPQETPSSTGEITQPIVCGHTPTPLLNSFWQKSTDIYVDSKKEIICIDTGCFFTGVLTVLNVSTGVYYQTC